MTMLCAPRISIASLFAASLALPLFAACGVESDSLLPEGTTELDERFELEAPANEDLDPTGQPCESFGAAATCQDGRSAAFCGVFTGDYALEFGACVPFTDIACVPGDTQMVEMPCGTVPISCSAWQGEPAWSEPVCDPEGEEGTPLVLRLDDAPIELIASEQTPAATFDIDMAADGGSCIVTDWPSAATPWLALDLDGNGTIDGGHELFGSGTTLAAAGAKARNGFEALAAHDRNHDGVIDALDPVYSRLVVWRDHDADRHSGPDELESLAAVGVEELALGYVRDRRCDARGNCGIERAGFATVDGSRGEIVDIHLACQ